MKTYLGNGFADSKPRCLDINDIRKHDAAHGNHADILITRDHIADSFYSFQNRSFIHERPWNKSQETSGIEGFLTLHFPYPNQMFEAFFNGFYVTKHHGGRGCEIQFMSHPH